MICVYPSNCTDFSNNGLGPVSPLSAIVTETLNGEWELTLTHPIDDHGKWQRLAEGNILRAPVPAAMTPQMNLVSQQYQTSTYDVEIYKVNTSRDPLRLRSGTGTKYKILGKYKKGTEIIVVDKTSSSWYEVTCPDGRHGYMSAEYLKYERTEQESYRVNVGFQNKVIESRQLRDQPFRIYRVVPELDRITVYARHIFYDLLDNMIRKIEPAADAVGASVVQNISSNCLSEHDFTFYSDLTTTANEVCFENINPVEAMLGAGGMAEKYGAELARDWFDVFLVRRVGVDSDVHIRELKNLTGISYDVDTTDVITRIMPTGEDADGNILYLPELYVDSPNIGVYTHPKWIHLPVSEAKEVAEGDDYKSLTSCYQDMRSAAQAEYAKGCDMPTVTLKVDFVNLVDAEEYKQYAHLQNIFLGDSVRVIARRIGIEVSMRMTQYTYDCLTKKYTSVTLGTAAATLEGTTVSARQLASGSITGTKLALNSIGSGHLQSGSVGSLQIKNAAISSAHIQSASITQAHIAEALIDVLNVNALNAVTAKIQELAAGSITTDELYASIAMIATAQLTTANIINANIDWAQIENLAAEIATISKAQITTANINEANIEWAAITTLSAAVASMVKADIGSADIDWAHIKDLATDTAIITQGVGGELYIAKLAVTEANLVSLTVGELVVKGEDGHFYAVSVDAGGNITTTLKQVSNDDVADLSIHGTEKLIEGSITAQTLNVQNIFGDNATIRSLIAANLDVDALFAREATIQALNAMDITSNTYLRLMVDGKADKDSVDALGQRMSAAELKITEDAIVQTVAGSQQYQDDLAAASSTGAGSVFVIGTQTTSTAAWTGIADIAELKDGQEITYWLPYNGAANVTLKLTLADGSMTDAVPCYYSQGTRLSTQYYAGNIIHLTYRENAKYFTYTIAKGWWADANYNSDTYDRLRFGSIKAKSAISASRFIVGDDAGYFHLAAGVPFMVRKPLLWTTSSCSAANSTSSAYLSFPSLYVRSHLSTFSGVQGESLYLVGMLTGDTFTPAANYLTSTIPVAEDGLTYMLLGHLTSAYYLCLFPEHPLYRYVEGAFKPMSQVAYEAYTEIGTLREETQTAIQQTNATIALKADKSTTDALSTRLASAEQKVTPESIVSTVTSSSEYQEDQTAMQTQIQQNANNIALKVSYATYNTEKVYRGTTAPASPYTNMLWLDISATPNLLKRYTGSGWVAVGAEEVRSSGVYIGPNQVAITTENFLLRLLDPANNENVLMEMSADGNVGFKELYADEVISDSVAQAYFGPSYLYVEPSATTTSEDTFRSLGDAVLTLNNRYLSYDVTIYLPWGMETYEPAGVLIRGISGPGKLRIYGYGTSSTLNSFIKIQGCFAHIHLQNISLRESRSLNGSNRQPYVVELQMNHYVELSGCTLDANNITYDSVYCRSTYLYIYNCGLYNALQGLEVFMGSAYVNNCKGSCSWAMVSYAGYIICSGTVPAGSRGTGNNGQIYATNVTTDYGTAIPAITPDENGILYASTTKSWRGSWRTDTLDVIQGVYSDAGYSSSLNWNRGCMWFSTAQGLLGGCTVKSATLTLHRKTGSGSSAAKTLYLCAITNTSASGTPSIAYNYGAIGTIGRGKQVTFSIPTAAVQGLADGTYGGLCLYESPYDFGSSTYSNCYMRMSGTDTDLEPYIECVFSGSTAVG